MDDTAQMLMDEYGMGRDQAQRCVRAIKVLESANMLDEKRAKLLGAAERRGDDSEKLAAKLVRLNEAIRDAR